MILITWFNKYDVKPTVPFLVCTVLEYFLELLLIFELTNNTFLILPMFIYFAFSLLTWSNKVL